jgi:hypothetical protein
MAFTNEEVTRLYVAYFDRAPDAAGLDYWVNHSGLDTLDQIAASFADQPETQEKYPDSLTDAEFVNTIYNNLFHRDAEPEGLDYWVNELENGNIDRPHMIEAIVNGAQDDEQGQDRTTLDNKTEVGLYVAVELGLDTVNFSLEDVTADPQSVEDAKEEAQKYVPINLDLTTGADDLAGSLGDDTFSAELLTLNDGDKIVDPSSEDNDQFTAEINDDISKEVTITDVENVAVTTYGSHDIDMKNITGVKNFTEVNSTGKLTLKNIGSADMSLGLEGPNTNTIDANYASGVLAGSDDTLKLKLAKASNVDVTTDSGFESVSIDVDGDSDIASLKISGANKLSIDGDGSVDLAKGVVDNFSSVEIANNGDLTIGDISKDIDTLKISNDGDATIGKITKTVNTLAVANSGKTTVGSINSVSSIEGAENQGGIVATNIDPTTGLATDVISTSTSGATIITGNGDDNINVTSNSNSLHSTTVKMGAGNDKLDLSAIAAGGFYFFGGEGDDLLNLRNTYSLSSSDVVDMGEGNDTVKVATDASHSLVAKGLETLEIIPSGAASATSTSIKFTSVDSAIDIVDRETVKNSNFTLTGLKNGSTFIADKAKVGSLEIGFANGAEAELVIDVQKGLKDNLTVENVETLTLKSGADAMTGGSNSIRLDGTAKTLSADVTGKFGTRSTDIVESSGNVSKESLESLDIKATDNVKLNNVTNDNSLKTVNIESTGTNTTIDTNSVVSAGKDMESITIKANGDIGASNTPDITAESVQSITAESVSGAANLGNLNVQDAVNHDGGIGSITVSGKTGAQIDSAATVDKIDSLTVSSSAGAAKTKAIDGATTKATLGTLKADAFKGAQIGNIGATTTVAALESAEAISNGVGYSATVGSVNVTNTTNTAVVSLVKAQADKTASIGNIKVDNIQEVAAVSNKTATSIGNIDVTAKTGKIGTIDATSTNGTVSIGDIGSTLAAAEIGSIDAQGGGDTTVGSVKSDKIGTINATSTKGTVSVGDIDAEAEIGSIDAQGGGDTTVGSVESDKIGDITISSTNGMALLGNTTSKKALDVVTSDGTIGDISISAKMNAKLFDVGQTTAPSEIGTITLTSKAGEVIIGDITVDDSNPLEITADAKKRVAGIAAAISTIESKKSGIDFTIKSASGALINKVDLKAGASATSSDIDISLTTTGTTNGTKSTITNKSTNDNSSVTVDLGGGANDITINAAAGTVKVAGNDGTDTINLSGMTSGTYDSSKIDGGKGDDSLTAGAGIDKIYGGEGDDTIDAGKGADTIVGEKGADKLTGGAGADEFIYLSTTDSDTTNGVDIIGDFVSGTDVIDLSGITGSNPGTNPSNITTAGSKLNGTANEFGGNEIAFYTDDTDTWVYFDSDGNDQYDAGTDLEIELDGITSVAAGDFLI